MKTVLVIDGNSILNRAFYGIRPLSTKDGLPTNAVYGFLNILKKHIDALAPDVLVCAFDRREPTFRHTMYDGYKATRKGMPEELAQQLPYAKEAAAALGATVISLVGYEADDILGTVARLGDASGQARTYILTGDRDSLQLVTPTTSVVLVKTKEDILYTPEVFTAEYGFGPERLIDLKALMGDSSDNIPGVSGIGEKTAKALLIQAGSLERIYADVEALGVSRSVTEKLIRGEESARLSYRLAEICRTAPIEWPLSDSAPDRERLGALLDRLEFTALRERLLPGEETPECTLSVPAFALYAGEAIPEEAVLAVALGEDGTVSLYSDTVAYTGADAGVLAGRHILCHDYKKLYTALSARGISVQCDFDTMLAAYLLAPGEGSYPLAKIAPLYLGAQAPEPAPEAEAFAVSQLSKILAEGLEERGMRSLLTEMEIPLSEVLAEMEREGFSLRRDGLHQYITELEAAAGALARRIYEQAGESFNLNSPKQLGEILFHKLGLPGTKKTRTGYSTDAETLGKLRAYHPIIADILDYRQLIKLCGTYGENLIALCDENGKIHTEFNQTGTATGRLSSVNPNMQNIPVRGELGRELRRFFTPSDAEHVLLDADYSQIELRLLAEIAGDEAMLAAFREGRDIHRSTAAQVFRVPEESVTQDMRKRAKAINFGIVYGIGDYSLSQDLAITRRQAADYIRGYLDTYPAVDAYLKKAVADAHERGYTETMLGRRRYIPELSAQNKNLRAFGERVAMNSPIQGTAADIIKLAMIATHRALRASGLDAKLILQVHDELIVEVARDDADRAAEILRREMEGACTLRVPLTVEVGRGDTWLDAKD